MEMTEAVEWSLSQLRIGDPLLSAVNAVLRPLSAAAGPAPNEHASTSELPCTGAAKHTFQRCMRQRMVV